ncbi:glucose-1-phosphate thymidylyltransferase RfbA [Streptomyces sp. NPDC051133]|uniref:glucose-1-phosphate thymidylyltransferase RfbA n=1 Tax=Streptomyces sp. NPDC051133 TaxID=3155521 RepID=UPI0034217D5B
MKGIILAGGRGTRLYPLTRSLSKQLLPVYNKPMIYYPLSVLMLSGIQDILIISSPEHVRLFEGLLGDGKSLGITLNYAEQSSPRGIAEALIIGEDYVDGDGVALILGDNIFHGSHLSELLQKETRNVDGCVLFGYPVVDPERYGVGEVDTCGRLVSIEEKPLHPRSNMAITGLYFYAGDVVDIAKGIRPSMRGELEITDINKVYLDQGRARLVDLGRGSAWMDTGTHHSLMNAAQYIQVLEERQGLRIACLEEIALRMGYITEDICHQIGSEMSQSDYGKYLMSLSSPRLGGTP